MCLYLARQRLIFVSVPIFGNSDCSYDRPAKFEIEPHWSIIRPASCLPCWLLYRHHLKEGIFTRQIRQLSFLAPFHLPTISFIHDYLPRQPTLRRLILYRFKSTFKRRRTSRTDMPPIEIFIRRKNASSMRCRGMKHMWPRLCDLILINKSNSYTPKKLS